MGTSAAPSLLALVLVLAGATGCPSQHNDNYCPGRNPNDNCSEPLVCAADDVCAAPAGVCDLTAGQCVQCLPEKASACAGATPACGECHARLHPAPILARFPDCSQCHHTAHDLNHWPVHRWRGVRPARGEGFR